MEKFDLFRDIAERTNGDIYIGTVGAVRVGKSTFIKKFMDIMVLPNMKNGPEKERAKDELPQSAAGKTIMTTEPKFVPNEAVEITLKDNIKFNIRLIDCPGYPVEGALGYMEDDGPRMVLTPWSEEEMPFEEAAEIGTRKVITEHATIGMVITTDGSFTEIPRANYEKAEERVITELKDLQKPFVVVLNSARPNAPETTQLRFSLEEKYDVPVLPVDVSNLNQEDIYSIMYEVLYEFPVQEVNIQLPKWVDELDNHHWLRTNFENAVRETVGTIKRVRDVDRAIEKFSTYEFIKSVALKNLELGVGRALIEMTAQEGLFYKVLSEVAGTKIEDEAVLLAKMKDYAFAKREYDKVADALNDVREFGYGIVSPMLEELTLEEPEIIRQGNRFGVKLKASAPSIHMIRADVKAEVSPIVGTEKQSEELVKYLLDEFESDPTKIWRTNLFGKSLNDLMREGIQNKIYKMPENAQQKLQETLQKIINEGSGGLICIIL